MQLWFRCKLMCSPFLKENLGLGREDCQQAVIDEFLCMVDGCALGTDVCHWMFKKMSGDIMNYQDTFYISRLSMHILSYLHV